MTYSSGDDSSVSGVDSVLSGVYTNDGIALATPGNNLNNTEAGFQARVAAEDERIAQEYDLPMMVIPRLLNVADQSNDATATEDDSTKIEGAVAAGPPAPSSVDKKVETECEESVISNGQPESESESEKVDTTLSKSQEDGKIETPGESQTVSAHRENISQKEHETSVPVPHPSMDADVDANVDVDADADADAEKDNGEEEDEDDTEAGDGGSDEDDGYDDVHSIIMPPVGNVAFPDVLGKKAKVKGPVDNEKQKVIVPVQKPPGFSTNGIYYPPPRREQPPGFNSNGIYYPPSYPTAIAQELPANSPPGNEESATASLGTSLSMLPLSAKSIFAGAYESLVESIRSRNFAQDAAVEERPETEEGGAGVLPSDAQSVKTLDQESVLYLGRPGNGRGAFSGSLPPLSSGSHSAGGSICNSVSSVRKLLGCRVGRLIVVATSILLVALCLAVGAKVASDRSQVSSIDDNTNETGLEPLFQSPTFAPLIPNPADPPTLPLFQDPTDSGLEDTPVAAPSIPLVVVPAETPKPSLAPTKGLVSPVASPTLAPAVSMTKRPTTQAPTTGSPVSASPTKQPVPAEIPVVVDCQDSTDTILVNSIQRTCAWFAKTSSGFQSFWCATEQNVLSACPKTCQACTGSGGTQDTAPSSSPSAFFFPTEPYVSVEPEKDPDDDIIIANQADVRPAVLKAAPSSTSLALDDMNSPQSEALSWLEERFRDEEQSEGLPSWRLQQQFALATFATEANNSGKRRLKKSKLGWMKSQDECQWTGVFCDGNGRILSITVGNTEVGGAEIGGSLPPEWSMLARSLEVIDLVGVGLTGSIPPEFGKLYKLKTLRLEENNLSGSIPEEVSGMVSLEELSLHSNQLSGDLPGDAISKLVNLQVLTVHRTDITGDLQPICQQKRQFISLIITCLALEGECWTLCYPRSGE